MNFRITESQNHRISKILGSLIAINTVDFC